MRKYRPRPCDCKPLLYFPDGTPHLVDSDTGSHSPKVEEIDFLELDDGTLAELVEDPHDATQTSLLLWKDGKASYRDRLEYRGKVFVPLKRDSESLANVRLPREATRCTSGREIAAHVFKLIRRCVALTDQYTLALVYFVVSSWFVDRLPIAPYLLVLGLPQSGKTTLLKTLGLLCRRSLLVGDTTSASFYDACQRLTPTLLIDEVGSHTGQSKRALFHLLRTGSTRDVVALTHSNPLRSSARQQ